MRKVHCPRCNRVMRVRARGTDHGAQVREVSHPTKRRVRTNLNDGRKGEYTTAKLRVGHRLVKFWPAGSEVLKRRGYRIVLECPKTHDDQRLQVVLRGRSYADAMRRLDGALRHLRRQEDGGVT